MAFNKMNNLLNKIERRLGTKPLMLPSDISKDRWVEDVIVPDTLLTFSRYFPHMVRVQIDTNSNSKKDGYYIINTDMLGGAEILGVKDIAWDVYGREDGGMAQQSGIGYYDYMSAYNNYSMDDVMLLQARADMTSIFNNSIFVDFRFPNMVRLQSATHGDITGGLGTIPLDIFVVHPSNLSTIPPTQMELMENLATSDVASYLVAYLQHYDGLETVFAGVDLKLSYIENWAGRRDDYINTLKEGYVNPANTNQPIMYCV